MPGMRGEDEILEAFRDLEYIPGSKKKRRDDELSVTKRRVVEEGSWDANPIIKNLGGREMEFFTISALADALEKSLVTVRLWERKGYIPRAPYRLKAKTLNGKKVGGNRVYTRPMIEAAIREFGTRGLLGTARVEWNQHQSLTHAIYAEWNAITSNERDNAS